MLRLANLTPDQTAILQLLSSRSSPGVCTTPCPSTHGGVCYMLKRPSSLKLTPSISYMSIFLDTVSALFVFLSLFLPNKLSLYYRRFWRFSLSLSLFFSLLVFTVYGSPNPPSRLPLHLHAVFYID